MNTKNLEKLKNRREFYKKSYETLSKPLIDTFGKFSLEDCEKYLIVNNVVDDQLVTFGNLYAIDNINRRMLDESEDVSANIEDLLSKALAFKFKSNIDDNEKNLTDELYEKSKDYFQTPQLKRLEQSILSVARAIMECFGNKYSQFEVSEDFLEYVSSLDRNESEVNRAYNIMKNLQRPEDNKQFERSFAKWIELLQSHTGNYTQNKTAMIMDKLKNITPDAVAYSRSKARDILNKKLTGYNEEYKLNNCDKQKEL